MENSNKQMKLADVFRFLGLSDIVSYMYSFLGASVFNFYAFGRHGFIIVSYMF